MVKTVARYFKWTPTEIDCLFCDEIDNMGLVFWYNDAVEQDRDFKKRIKK